MKDGESKSNPYAPPKCELGELVVETYYRAQRVKRRSLSIAVLLSVISPVVLLLDAYLLPSFTLACLVFPVVLAFFTQRGMWRAYAAGIAVSYTILSGLVGAFVYFTFFF